MFIKNDQPFICKKCGVEVKPLGYTSRDHCNKCLYSVHVDVNPGDRENTCCGFLKPVAIITVKGEQKIVYKCEKCGQIIRNIVAKDDEPQTIYEIVKEYAKNGGI